MFTYFVHKVCFISKVDRLLLVIFPLYVYASPALKQSLLFRDPARSNPFTVHSRHPIERRKAHKSTRYRIEYQMPPFSLAGFAFSLPFLSFPKRRPSFCPGGPPPASPGRSTDYKPGVSLSADSCHHSNPSPL